MKLKDELLSGWDTAFVDRGIQSRVQYRPEFISNDLDTGKKVISSLEQELTHCDSFCMSVAFITSGGITPLLQTLKEMEERGIPGRILTTDYQLFNDPKALKKLNCLHNLEVRMYLTNDDQDGFHTKGYIFQQDEIYHIIIGSSNLTQKALKVNREWNTKFIGYKDGEIVENVLEEFEMLWNDPHTKTFDEFYSTYLRKYDEKKTVERIVAKQRQIAQSQLPPSSEMYHLEPNQMQATFVHNLEELVKRNEKKALLISATGTGKTYASAFGLRQLHTKRILFIAHREQIVRQAMESYQKVFGYVKNDRERYQYTLLSGNTTKNTEELLNSDFVFATIQMINKDEVLHLFMKSHFSAICLDEAHHSGANSYQKVMSYFQPDLWLGMTASPETNRFDVYQIFDNNIVYEIRLQQALQNNLLCPFHYFGIQDIEIDGSMIGDDDSIEGPKSFHRLVSDERVNNIIEKAEYFGYSGDRVKGLIFCSRKEEAKELSEKMNQRGYRTSALTGEDSDTTRREVIEKLAIDLQNNPGSDYLDYIITVDIFSEGVDIPEVNQVIMLRPTKSTIVFVQQLGRGLRKFEGKEYVVILDFIGNYKNNFMIPIALSGDRSFNKDNTRRYVMEGNRFIPGESTIHFDEVSRKSIFKKLDEANFSDIRLIKESYTNLKYKLGRIPTLQDFDIYGSIDVCRIFDNKLLGSYYKFLLKYEKSFRIRLSSEEEKMIEFISKKLASGKRPYELLLLQILLSKNTEDVFSQLEQQLMDKYQIEINDSAIQNILNIMTNKFPTGTGKNTYKECIFIQLKNEKTYSISDSFKEKLKNHAFFDLVQELVSFGLSRYMKNYRQSYQDTNFVLYEKYTYEDVCRLLNWEKGEVSLNIGGYKFDKQTHTFPVFINYEKEDNISSSIKYEDRFVSENLLIAISKSGRTLQSDDVQNFLYSEERGIQVHLFVRKNKDDNISKEFYYLGTMKPNGNSKEFVMLNTNKTAVEIEWLLDTPVRSDIYDYITES